jgi:predicted ATPase
VQSKPVTIVNVKPLAVSTPEPVAVTSNSVARVVVADAQERVMVKDDFQGSFTDPKNLPSEMVGLINKTDTEDQLKQLQKRMADRGYKLELDNTTYVNGALANVIAKVSTRGGEKASFSATDFDNVLLIESQEKNGKYAGFHIVIKTGTKYTTIQ